MQSTTPAKRKLQTMPGSSSEQDGDVHHGSSRVTPFGKIKKSGGYRRMRSSLRRGTLGKSESQKIEIKKGEIEKKVFIEKVKKKNESGKRSGSVDSLVQDTGSLDSVRRLLPLSKIMDSASGLRESLKRRSMERDIKRKIKGDNREMAKLECVSKLRSQTRKQNEACQVHYTSRLKGITISYKTALQNYIHNDPKKHSNTLQQCSHRCSFILDQTKSSESNVSVLDLPPSYDQFVNHLEELLRDHKPHGTLCKHIVDNLNKFGFEFDYQNEIWTITLSLPEPEFEQKQNIYEQASTSSNEQAIAEQLKRQETIKINIIKKINARHDILEQSIARCTSTKKIIGFQKKYDGRWIEPKYKALIVSIHPKMDQDAYMQYDLVQLGHLQGTLDSEIKAHQTFIAAMWDSLPASSNSRTTVSFSEEISATKAINEALTLLDTPPQRRFEAIRQRLFQRAYERESQFKEELRGNLTRLQVLPDELARHSGWEHTAQSLWYANLTGECLRQGIPPKLNRVGRITISSSLRKSWKEKLAEWGIPRRSGTA